MEPAAPAQQLWASCVEKVDLRPQQKQQICTAYHIHSQQVASLLQQQQEVMQQLQSLLGTTGALELPPTSSEAAAAQTSPAAAAGTAAARPAHFMSLVAGTAEGSAEQHEAASPLGAVRASHAVVEAVSDGEARPGSLDAAAAAAGKSGGASSAAQLRRAAAAAAGSSCGSSTFLSSALLGDSYSRDSAAATQQPAAGLDPIQEASAGHGSSITDAGASMSSAGIGSSITSVGSSSGGNLQGPIGVLALEDAERVEQLLQELMRISLQLKQQGRSLSTLVSHAAVLRFAVPCCTMLYAAAPCCVVWGGWGRPHPHALTSLCHLSHACHPQHSSADCINRPSSAAMMQALMYVYVCGGQLMQQGVLAKFGAVQTGFFRLCGLPEGGGDSHRLATHNAIRQTRLPGARGRASPARYA